MVSFRPTPFPGQLERPSDPAASRGGAPVSRPLVIVWRRCALAQYRPHPSHSPALGRLGPSGHAVLRFRCGMAPLCTKIGLCEKNFTRHTRKFSRYNPGMDELTHALDIEGSCVALAKALGIDASRVRKWKRSLPEPWRLVLRAKYGRRKPKTAPPTAG